MPGDEKKVLIRTREQTGRFNFSRAKIPGMFDIDAPFTVQKLPARIVVGISRRTSNADGRSVDDIPATWTDFLKQNANAKIKNRAAPPVMYAVYSDYASDWKGEYSYMIGAGVTRAGTVPEGMDVRKIPAQTYAVFHAKGWMPDAVTAIWAEIWLSSLPRKYTYDFEVYDRRFMHPTAKVVDICIAVDSKKMKDAGQAPQ
jgi:predicted transcriptional regulator YdeE